MQNNMASQICVARFKTTTTTTKTTTTRGTILILSVKHKYTMYAICVFCMIFKFINNIMFLYNFQFVFKSIFG